MDAQGIYRSQRRINCWWGIIYPYSYHYSKPDKWQRSTQLAIAWFLYDQRLSPVPPPGWECMETDIFTVQQTDIIELVAEMMDWRKVRYLPVEDAQRQTGRFGYFKALIEAFCKNRNSKRLLVSDVMIKTPTPRYTLKTLLWKYSHERK